MPPDGCCPLEELGLAVQFASELAELAELAEPAEPAKPAKESGAGTGGVADDADLQRLGREWNRVLSADLHMEGVEQKSDVDDASLTDETVLAEPGSPYDLVAPVPLPTDVTMAQMLTEQA
eukprot:scaffold14035_cov67-Phaeocystis_antarctica.AAC.2